MKSIISAVLILLLLSTHALTAQREYANLGSLKLSKKQYWDMAIDKSGLILIAYGSNERRDFRLYDQQGNLKYAHALKEGYGPVVSTPYGYLESKTSFTYFFPSMTKKYQIEKIVIAKDQKKTSIEGLKITEQKIKILNVIKAENSLILIAQNRKTKALEYHRIFESGKMEKGALNANSAVIAGFLGKHEQFQQVSPDRVMKPEELISAKKIYTIEKDRFLITIDPLRSNDRGAIKLITLDLNKGKLTYRKLANEVTLNRGSVRSFVHRGHLYRLVTEYAFLDLSIYDLSDQRRVAQFHYTNEDPFDLANSKIETTGALDFFGMEKLNESLAKSGKIIRSLAKGQPILSVTERKDGLKELQVGSYTIKTKNATTGFNFPLAQIGPGINIGLSMGLYPMNSSIMVTKFKTLLKADSYELAPEKVALVDTQERMRRYVQDRKKEIKGLFSFPYTEGRTLLAVEQKKGGEIKLLNFRYF